MWFLPHTKTQCPRCKGQPAPRSKGEEWFFFCVSCKAIGPRAKTVDEAAGAWDTWSKEQSKSWEAR